MKLTLLQYYYIIYRAYSYFSNCFNTFLYSKKKKKIQDHALHFISSLFSFLYSGALSESVFISQPWQLLRVPALFCRTVWVWCLLMIRSRLRTFCQDIAHMMLSSLQSITSGGTCGQLVPLLVMSHLILQLRSYLPSFSSKIVKLTISSLQYIGFLWGDTETMSFLKSSPQKLLLGRLPNGDFPILSFYLHLLVDFLI